MIRRLRIAVVGAGVSGLAAASLFKIQGNDVTVFERFRKPRPIGSGLVLQRTGLAVLANLGLDQKAVACGAKLTRFEGKTLEGKSVFDLSHENLAHGHFSLGIHRHSLFTLLYDDALSLNIDFVTDFDAAGAEGIGDRIYLVSRDGRRLGAFDLIVDASGTHSVLRDKYASIQHRRPFVHGALWGIYEDECRSPRNVLRQRFHRADVSIGLIPIGRMPGTENQCIGFHWSIRNSEYESWRLRPITRWKDDVVRLWEEAAALVAQIKTHDDLTHAVYTDIALRRFFTGRIAFIGDSAHSISPRLGQGANLGLVDALLLSREVQDHEDLDEALRAYDRVRRDHVRFYHSASKWLSLLFQSDSLLAPALRDIAFAPISKVPYFRTQMLESLSGLKTGLFSRLEPGTLHERYAMAIRP